MKFSICVPCFGNHKDLLKAIASLEQQSESDFEIVLVCDQPSNEKLIGAINNLLHNSSMKISVIYHSSNQGIIPSTLEAVRASKGEYVVLLDMDDELTHTALEIVGEAISSCEKVGVQADALFSQRTDVERRLKITRSYDTAFQYPTLSSGCIEHNFFSHLKVYRRSYFQAIPTPISSEGFQDWIWLNHTIRSEDANICLIRQSIYKHHIHKKQTSSQNRTDSLLRLNMHRRQFLNLNPSVGQPLIGVLDLIELEQLAAEVESLGECSFCLMKVGNKWEYFLVDNTAQVQSVFWSVRPSHAIFSLNHYFGFSDLSISKLQDVFPSINILASANSPLSNTVAIWNAPFVDSIIVQTEGQIPRHLLSGVTNLRLEVKSNIFKLGGTTQIVKSGAPLILKYLSRLYSRFPRPFDTISPPGSKLRDWITKKWFTF